MLEMNTKQRDVITGFSGVVTGRAEYLTGCRQYLLQAKSKDHKGGEAIWFDEDRLIGTFARNPGGLQQHQAPVK